MHRNQFPGHQMPSADPSNWHFRKYMCGHWSLGINRLPPIAATVKAVAATVDDSQHLLISGVTCGLIRVEKLPHKLLFFFHKCIYFSVRRTNLESIFFKRIATN